MPRALDALKTITDYIMKTKRFEQHLKKLNPISLSNDEYNAEFVVTENDLNTYGRFHEGLTATLVDITSGMVLHSIIGKTGLSTNIHITYYKPALLGDVLSINTKLYRLERPLAYLEVELSKNNGKEIVARGQHTLFVGPADSKDHKP